MTTLTSLTLIATVAAGVFGLAIGSFLNVVIYRVPNGLSVVRPASACPNCGYSIKSHDNIPVLSWLILRGKCRNCKNGISSRYPLVEAGTGIFFAVVTGFLLLTRADLGTTPATVGTTLVLIAFLYLVAITVALALIDIDTKRLPDAIVLPGYAVGGILFLATSILTGSWDALLRAAIGMAALWIFYFLLVLVRPGGMGLGDVKLAGVLGLFLGWVGWGPFLVGAFGAFLLGGIFGVALMLAGRAKRRSGIPFGPWMLAGAWLGVFFGNQIWSGYLSLVGFSS
jgi:leader peptidase (prepilin peptidase)/N-methyltransferase